MVVLLIYDYLLVTMQLYNLTKYIINKEKSLYFLWMHTLYEEHIVFYN